MQKTTKIEMKNLKTYESWLDEFRPKSSQPLPQPEETQIQGQKIGKITRLEYLIGRTIRDNDEEVDCYINENNIEFYDFIEKQILYTFNGLPDLGEIINQNGDILSDDDLELLEDGDTTLYLDDFGNYFEICEVIDGRMKVELTFSIKESQDVTDVLTNEACSVEELTEYELMIDNEYSKLERGIGDGMIDLGKIGQVSNTVLNNIQKTYPKSILLQKDGRYILSIKEK